MKRPAPWQLAKQRTAKALRELPKCEECGSRAGMGWSAYAEKWLCPQCAQRARRERT